MDIHGWILDIHNCIHNWIVDIQLFTIVVNYVYPWVNYGYP